MTHALGTTVFKGMHIGSIIKWVAEILFPDTFTEYLDEDRTLRSRFYGNNFGFVEVYSNLVVWTVRDTNGAVVFTKVLNEDDFQ